MKTAHQVIQIQDIRGNPVVVPWDEIERANAAIDSASPSVQSIIEATARHFGLTAQEIKGQSRFLHVIRARHVAMYLARLLTPYSSTRIGRQFGNRDHSSILHAVGRIEEKMPRDAALTADVERVKAEVLAQEGRS